MMSEKRINIAIDGYSSCGKSTIAKALSKRFSYIYVDTGAMYRAVALFCLRRGVLKDNYLDLHALLELLPEITITFSYNQEHEHSEVLLNGENVEKEIRTMNVSRVVSLVSAVKEVRKKLVSLQQAMGANRGVVMDGRDIGTVVFPDAEVKLFMTADPDIRTKRRYDELTAKGQKVLMDEVKKNLLERDHIDTHRAEDPLKKAEDAIVIDNTELSLEDQLNIATDLVMSALNR